MLPAVTDHLLEQAVVVADAEAVGRDAEARHALHEAGGQPPEAAIAERRVRLQRAQPIEVHAELGERLPHRLGQAGIVQRVQQHAARQELQRQIVDPLACPAVSLARALQPAIDDPIAQRQRRRHKPVAIAGDQRVSPGRVGKLLRDQAAQRLDVFLVMEVPVRAAWPGITSDMSIGITLTFGCLK